MFFTDENDVKLPFSLMVLVLNQNKTFFCCRFDGERRRFFLRIKTNYSDDDGEEDENCLFEGNETF